MADIPNTKIEPSFYRCDTMRWLVVTCVGRSGSKWLARELNTQPGVVAVHEPDGGEQEPLREAFFREDAGRSWLDRHKLPRMRTRASEAASQGAEVYVEVNPYLRYHAPLLRDEFDIPTVFLVRHGIETVRSILTRRSTQKPWSIGPRPGERYRDRWPAFSLFQRVCWYWWHAYERWDGPVLRLEDCEARRIVEDVTGIRLVADPDKTAVDQTERKPEVSTEEALQFREICGALMSRLGYA